MDMTEEKKSEKKISFSEVKHKLWTKRFLFIKVWVITFVLSVIWIYPQPRFYIAKTSLAPEANGESTSSLAGIASSFGLKLGSGTTVDALYPSLYPDLMGSNEFIARIMPVKVTTFDGKIKTDYYTYLKKHQKVNVLKLPFIMLAKSVSKAFGDKHAAQNLKATELNPFCLSKDDNDLFEAARSKIRCEVDKKTDVITISVTDQDKLVCAALADSVCRQLQNAIILYRTKKANADVVHYKELADSAYVEYQHAINDYARFCDSNQESILQSVNSKRDRLENAMQLKYTTYQTLVAQLENAKAKLQERTPAFTILSGPSVPIKPTGPKRVMFILGMLVLVTIILVPKVIGQDMFMAMLRKVV
jgi:uncharacterized protein involved in exopolysaccharide biosynthesis